MQDTAFIELIQWVINHGYLIFYLATFLEGPLVTTAAGVATGLGYFNIYLVIGVAILGDLSADVVYYAMGYWGGKPLIKKYGHYIGLTETRAAKIQKLLHRHAGKTMLFIKVGSIIAIPGIIIMGSAHVPLKKFVRYSLLVTLPKSTFFALLGLYSAKAYQHLAGTVVTSQYVALTIVGLVILIYILYKKFTDYAAKQLEENI